MSVDQRDIRLEVPHDHSQPGAMFGCPGCIRAVKVLEYRIRCELMTTEDLIDCTSLDGPPWWWGNIVADEVLRNRFGGK